MGVRDVSKLANYAYLHLQDIRKLYITVEVLDKDNNTIETIQGLSIGGDVNVSGGSLIKRAGNLSFILLDEFLPKKDGLLWMTNKIRVYAGIENLASAEATVTHFCLGTFYITEPAIDITSNSRTVDIALQDNMMRWEQEQLENKLVFEADTPLNTAVISLMQSLGEFNLQVEFTDLKVPYKMEFDVGTTILDVLTKLRDLYMDWECYYDVDGTFVFRKMQVQRENGEPIAWRFDKGTDLITAFKESFTYKNVKNRVVAMGEVDEKTGVTPKSEATIISVDSPFHESTIGKRTLVIKDGSLKNNVQCDAKARYELFKSSTFQEQLDIDTLPIYYLDANNIIEVVNHATKELERYVVDSIGIGLGISDTMGLSCHKVYYNQFDDIGSSLGDFQKSADIIIDGITNKGWLSLSESRVKEYLGLEGDGSKLIVKFEYQGLHGTTAYVTGFMGESTQTLTVDLADFNNVQGDNGDSGNGKSEYSDRVLGHEMVHAIMNNSLGLNKIVALPEWFKEGIAELIHGADERFKISITVNGVVNDEKLKGIISRATELMKNAIFKSESDDYSAGYLVLKYLNHNFKAGKSMKDFMWTIKQAPNANNLIQDAVVANTVFASYDAFVTAFTANAFNHAKTKMHLNVGTDETDTGSIGGSDENGSTPLNAEDVFDNSKAVQGIPAIGFNVEFMRP